MAQLREGEVATALMMFAYSFLAMTAYNILKPITRSKFIARSAPTTCRTCSSRRGLLIGVLMQVLQRGRRHGCRAAG